MILLGQMGCEKKNETPNPKFDSYIDVTPVLSWSVSVPNEKIVIYSGDTLAYKIKIIPKSRVGEVNVYIINEAKGIKILLQNFPITKGTTSFNMTFRYPVNTISTFFPFKLSVEVKETNGSPATSMDFGPFDSLSTVRVYKNLEIFEYHDLANNSLNLNPGQKTCIMYDVLTHSIKLSSDTNEWKNYSILLPYVQQTTIASITTITSGISTVSYKDLADTLFPKQTSYAYKTRFKILSNLPPSSFDTVLTHRQIKSLFDNSKDTAKTFKKGFDNGIIVAQIYSNKQDSVSAYPGIFTYALIRINSNTPNGKLDADLKIYNPFTF
jgi:hypothetical protein